MATYTQGTIGTEDINSARVVKDFSDKILLLDPSRTPFLVFSSKLSKQPAYNMKFEWQEDEIIGHRSTITTSETVSLTAGAESAVIEVDDVDLFTVGDMLLIEDTGVIGYITDVEDTESDHIKIIPGFDAADTATNITGDEEIQKIGAADAEGNGPRDENRRQIDEVYNYLQIFKKNFSMTDIQQATKTYNTESDWSYLRTKKGKEHKEDIERALWWGGRTKSTSATIGDHPTWTTRGVFNFISTNVTTIGNATALTEATFNEFLRDKGFAHGSDKKTLFASRTLAHQISTWATDSASINMKPGANQPYGIHVDSYTSSLGYELDVVVHKFFTGTKYGQCGAVVDMDAVNLRYLKGNNKNFDTKLLVDIKKDGVHKQIDEYYSVMGLEMRQEKRHAALFNTLDNS